LPILKFATSKNTAFQLKLPNLMLAKFSHYMEYKICHADDNTSILSYSKCMFHCSFTTYMLVYYQLSLGPELLLWLWCWC